MSDNARLGINITATNEAGPSIKELETTIKALEQRLAALNQQAAGYGASAKAAFEAEAAAVRGAIQQIESEIIARGRLTAAMREQLAEAEFLNREYDLQREKQLQLALNENQAGDARERRIRKEMAAHNERVYAEQKAEDVTAAVNARRTRQEADYENRDRDLAEAKIARENKIAQAAEVAALKDQRNLADYENNQRRAGEDQTRRQADYENRDVDLAARKRARDIADAQAAAALEERNRQIAYDGMRAQADAENEQRNRVNRLREQAFRQNLPGVLESQGILPERSRAETMAMREQYTRQFQARGPVHPLEISDANLAKSHQAIDEIQQELRQAEQAGRAAGQAIEGGMVQGARGATVMGREMRHVVGAADSLARGQFGQFLSSIGAGARDAGLGTAALGVSIGGVIAIMVGRGILHGAENMGKWATETRAAASAAGMSIASFSQLQGAMQVIGLKADEVDQTTKRLAVNLATALADPTSKAAEAFHALGISQEQLVTNGANVEGAMKMLANAFHDTNNSANKTAALSDILGRSFQNLIPLFENGAQGLESYEAQAKKLGITLDEETAQKLEQTGRKADELSLKIKGESIAAFVAWGGTIEKAIGLVGKLGDTLNTVSGYLAKFNSLLAPITGLEGKIAGFFGAEPPQWATNAANYLRGKVGLAPLPSSAQTTSTLPPPSGVHAGEKFDVPGIPNKKDQVTTIEEMRRQMAQAALAASQGKGSARDQSIAADRAEIQVMQQTLAAHKLNAKETAEVETELANKQMALSRMMATAGAAAAKQGYADFAAAEKLKIAEADGSSQKIIAIYDEWIAAANGKYRQHASVVAQIEREKVQAVNRARLDEIKEGARLSEQQTILSTLDLKLRQVQDPRYRQRQAGPEADFARAVDDRAQAAQVQTSAQAEVSQLMEVMQTAEQGSATQKQAAEEILSVITQAKQKEISLYQDAAQATNAAVQKQTETFVKFFDQMGSGFDNFAQSAVKSLIAPQQYLIKAGLTTIHESFRGQELKQAAGQFLTSIVSKFAETLQSALSKTIANALSGGASNTISELLGNWLSKGFSSIIGNTAGNAIGGAAGSAASSAASSAATSAAITASTTALTGTITATSTAETTSIVAAITSLAGIEAAGFATMEALQAATAVKPEVLGFSYAGGGIVPSAAGGMVVGGLNVNDGKGGMLSVLHPREMVLPARISEGIQGMIGRGTGGNTFQTNMNYNPTVNTNTRGRGGTGMSRGEFMSAMALHGGALLGEARNMVRNGWRPA